MTNLHTFQVQSLSVYYEIHKLDAETNIKVSKCSQSIVATITFIIWKKKSQLKLFKGLYVWL